MQKYIDKVTGRKGREGKDLKSKTKKSMETRKKTSLIKPHY